MLRLRFSWFANPKVAAEDLGATLLFDCGSRQETPQDRLAMGGVCCAFKGAVQAQRKP